MSNRRQSHSQLDVVQPEFGKLLTLAYWWLKNEFARDLRHEDWQEIASDAVYRLATALARGQYDNRRASINTFLKHVTRNLAIDHYRRVRRRLPPALGLGEGVDPCDPFAEDEIEAAIERVTLRQLLEEFGPDMDSLFISTGLTPEQQVAFKMTVLTGMTSGEVGSVLGVSAKAVRSRLMIARRKIDVFRARISRERR